MQPKAKMHVLGFAHGSILHCLMGFFHLQINILIHRQRTDTIRVKRNEVHSFLNPPVHITCLFHDGLAKGKD